VIDDLDHLPGNRQTHGSRSTTAKARGLGLGKRDYVRRL
jgi:hypothetical protein